MNKVILIGNNVKEIELKKTNSGKSVCEFTIAINEKYADTETTEFIDCRAWDKNADNISKYLKKGNKIGIEGKYHTDTYDRPDGTKVRKTLVVVHSFEFLTPKESVDTPKEYTPKNIEDYETTKKLDIKTDELPFY